jgi:diaminohydroxyphosphoribosylaminopyrimidine deaminase/5-amino-6-(5-phosphoribosylamino)uracil reductase
MREAIDLARKGLGLTHPNPLVGAVITKNGAVIGRGFHSRCGGPHAEIVAIEDARKNGAANLSDATLYVTLEPCCHTGRTPPCVDRIISSGIRSVVAGMTDPNPIVAGKGFYALEKAGVAVTKGVLERECRELNKIFIKYILTHRPYVLLKMAMTIDGKTTLPPEHGKWISCDASRMDAHRLRSEYTAITCGIGTILADDPRLDVRLVEGRNPVRIIVDSRFRIPANSRIMRSARESPTIVCGCHTDNANAIRTIEQAGARVIIAKERNNHVDLDDLMRSLGEIEIDSILLEGGRTLARAALAAGIVDEVRYYIAPDLFGAGEEKEVSLGNVYVSRSGRDVVIGGSICSRE